LFERGIATPIPIGLVSDCSHDRIRESHRVVRDFDRSRVRDLDPFPADRRRDHGNAELNRLDRLNLDAGTETNR